MPVPEAAMPGHKTADEDVDPDMPAAADVAPGGVGSRGRGAASRSTSQLLLLAAAG